MTDLPPKAPPLSILMYHQIGPYPSPKAHRALFCDIGRFRRQLKYLKVMGFQVLTLEQARDSLFGTRPLTRRSVAITVDDGYEDFHRHAWPALQEHGFPATVFLVSSLVGQTARWLQGNEGGFAAPNALMGPEVIRQLRREGAHFGSHACTHPRLSTLAEDRMRGEIFDSKAALEDLLGETVSHFCYPYGDYNERARDLVIEAGYTTGSTCIRGAANTADNPFELPRKAISYGDNLIGYAWKLHVKHARKG